MADELIDIYDENRNPIGTAMKHLAHQEGLWHAVIHCWIVKNNCDNQHKIWFQLRAKKKELSSDLFCISSSGHLLAGETPQDGIREIEEEIGLKVDYSELKKLFTNKVSFKRPNIFNQEFEEVFLLNTHKNLDDLEMQPDEVAGVFEANIKDVISLLEAKHSHIEMTGYCLGAAGTYTKEIRKVCFDDLVPHGAEYYLRVMRMAEDYLSNMQPFHKKD